MPTLSPTSFSADFETAATSALLKAYEHNEIAHHGCLYHFRASIDRQVIKKKLRNLLKQTRFHTMVSCSIFDLCALLIAPLQIRLLYALAYVPVDRLEEYAKVAVELIAKSDREGKLNTLVKSFVQTWIGKSFIRDIPLFNG
jgi:hypothetical protein